MDLLQAAAESSKMADTKPKILENADKMIAWKFPDVTESTQLRAIRLPDPLSASKVCSRSMPLRCTKKILYIIQDNNHKFYFKSIFRFKPIPLIVIFVALVLLVFLVVFNIYCATKFKLPTDVL